MFDDKVRVLNKNKIYHWLIIFDLSIQGLDHDQLKMTAVGQLVLD